MILRVCDTILQAMSKVTKIGMLINFSSKWDQPFLSSHRNSTGKQVYVHLTFVNIY